MGTKTDSTTPVILKKLALYVPSFYLIYYLLSIILVGGFKAGWKELGRFPFRIRKSEFSPEHGGAALGAWLAMVLTYTCSLALTYFIVKATRKSWDYVVSTSLVHFILCIIVNQAFPVNWIWWVTMIIANMLLSIVAEVTNYYLREMRDIDLERV